MSSNILAFYDDQGQSLQDTEVKFEAKAGFESVRRIVIQNIHVYPIEIKGVKPMHPNVSVLSYPTNVLMPQDKGVVDLQYNAPENEVNQIMGTIEIDARIGYGPE